MATIALWEQVSIGHRNWGEFYRLFAAKFFPWLVFWFVLKVVFSIGCVVGIAVTRCGNRPDRLIGAYDLAYIKPGMNWLI
ncbi:hypothetical protein HKD37_14G040316 [Glycine soja]